MVERPDIVLIVLDTQRADRLSCYGYEHVTTPAIDSFAGDATRFAAAMAPAQWTVPTHASMFTGLYPSQHTMHQMKSALPPALPTLAQRLSDNGYYSVGFSQNPLIGLVKNDLDRGFQRFESFHLLSNILLTTLLNRPDRSLTLPKRLELGLRWLMAEALGYSYETPLQHLAPVLAPLWQWLLRARGRSKIASTSNLLEAASRVLVNREGCPPEQPVFLFVNLMGAHVPYDPDRRLLERFLPSSFQKRQISALLRWANSLQIDVSNWLNQPLPPDKQMLLNAIYDAEVATQDAQLGVFLQRLRDAQRYDHTLLAVVADHGDHLGDKERVNHGFGVYQPLVHVPLIVRAPSQSSERGQVREEPVSTRRLFHTLLEAAGAATAEEAGLSLFAPAGGIPTASEPVFSEGFPLEWAVGRLQGEKAHYAEATGYTHPIRAVREQRHKLIVKDRSRELYDLQSDAAELQNLQASLPGERHTLESALDHFLAWARPAAGAEIREEDDAQVLQQLRDLGYLE